MQIWPTFRGESDCPAVLTTTFDWTISCVTCLNWTYWIRGKEFDKLTPSGALMRGACVRATFAITIARENHLLPGTLKKKESFTLYWLHFLQSAAHTPHSQPTKRTKSSSWDRGGGGRQSWATTLTFAKGLRHPDWHHQSKDQQRYSGHRNRGRSHLVLDVDQTTEVELALRSN